MLTCTNVLAVKYASLMQSYVFKIAGNDEWAEAEASGNYSGSPDDARDGFIHFSSAAQVAGTLTKHFAGRNALVLACVDTARLGDDLKWEVSRGGKAFPHLYADLPMSAVVRSLPIPDGTPGALAADMAEMMAAKLGAEDVS